MIDRPVHRGVAVVATLVAGIVLAGCSGGSDEGAAQASAEPSALSSPGITDPDLADRVLIATSITEGGAPRALAGPEPVTISIAGEGISARAGCNTLLGTARLEDGVLTIDGPMASTQMACEDALMEQDAWLAGFLTSGPTVTVEEETVTLASGDTVMTLVADADAAMYDTPIAGPEDYEAVTVLCEELVATGATVEEATARAEDAGFVLRVVSQDGEPLAVTMDLNPGRLNLEVEGDVVAGCTAG